VNKTIDPRSFNSMTRDTLALIMAGGRGTRLKELTLQRAKPATPFGGKFRMIDFTLSNCINSGLCRIGVLTQYKSHSLLHHLHAGWSFLHSRFGEFVKIMPADQNETNNSWYKGTADAVYQNIDFIQTHRPKRVLVLAGDHIYKMDYGQMIRNHIETGADCTVGCVETPIEEATEFGVLQINPKKWVCKFEEKSPTPSPIPGNPDQALASMGIYVFETDFLLDELKKDAANPTSSHDFGKDILPHIINTGKVTAHRFRDMYDDSRAGFWRDVGTLDAYWKTNMELLDVTPEFNMYDEQWPIWTCPEQLPPAKFVLNNSSARGMAVDSLITSGCIISGAKVERSIFFESARVANRSTVKESLILPGAKIGRGCRITRAIIDADCEIPDGMVIGENAEQDNRYFTRTEEGVVLVTQDMLSAFHAESVSTKTIHLSA
jgi:glucose-1-phosphate adenylyltransferase